MRAAVILALMLLATPVPAEEMVLALIEVAETKALYGRVESRFEVPARSRTAGTVTELIVTEGSAVAGGEVIARILDTKLESRLAAAGARITAAQSQLNNAEDELVRYEALLKRGATTAQRVDQVRTTVEIARTGVTEAEAAREIALQQIAEGAVLAPAAGRVLTVPVRLGEVVMAGEPVATVAGGGVFLRLAIPERHAAELALGTMVQIEDGIGRIEKLYPQIEAGRVTADVAVEGLSDKFIGQRILVEVPVALRQVIAVPDAAIARRGGLDMVKIRRSGGEVEVTVVPGPLIDTATGPMREILSGLRPGDAVILP